MNTRISRTILGRLGAIAVAVLIAAAVQPARATIVNLMSNAQTNGISGFNFGGIPNGNEKNLSDGNLSSWLYAFPPGNNSANYDLGFNTDLNLVGVRTLNDNGNRKSPTDVVLSIFPDNTFTTPSLSVTVPLAKPSPWTGGSTSYNLVPIADIPNARFIQFTFVGNHNYNDGTDPNGMAITELELFNIPEPSSMWLLGVGGLMVWRKLRSRHV